MYVHMYMCIYTYTLVCTRLQTRMGGLMLMDGNIFYGVSFPSLVAAYFRTVQPLMTLGQFCIHRSGSLQQMKETN